MITVPVMKELIALNIPSLLTPVAVELSNFVLRKKARSPNSIT